MQGSEAVEAAMKLAVKYFAELGVPNRAGFIARAGAFHGTTLGSLALSGKVAFRKPFEPLLKSDMVSFVSMPNTYRGMLDGETTEEYVERLACELDAEFELRGPNNVCAFIAETVSGSVSFQSFSITFRGPLTDKIRHWAAILRLRDTSRLSKRYATSIRHC